jgi:hypothetical protein
MLGLLHSIRPSPGSKGHLLRRELILSLLYVTEINCLSVPFRIVTHGQGKDMGKVRTLGLLSTCLHSHETPKVSAFHLRPESNTLQSLTIWNVPPLCSSFGWLLFSFHILL